MEVLEGQLNLGSRKENHRIRGEIDVLKKSGYKVKRLKNSKISKNYFRQRILTAPKVQSVVNKIENGMIKIEKDIEELKKKIPFTVRPTQLLGKDRNRN